MDMGGLLACVRVILMSIVEKYSGHGRTRGMCEGNIKVEWT